MLACVDSIVSVRSSEAFALVVSVGPAVALSGVPHSCRGVSGVAGPVPSQFLLTTHGVQSEHFCLWLRKRLVISLLS